MREARLEAVWRAAGVVQDRRLLSTLLDVSMSDVLRWLDGFGCPPVHVFLRAVDIVHQGPTGVPSMRQRTDEGRESCDAEE